MEPIIGEFFYRNYLRSPLLSSDSERMRFRVATFLRDYFESDAVEVGRDIEKELGFKVVSSGARYYVDWMSVLSSCSISDFLDIITLISRKHPQRLKSGRPISIIYNFHEFMTRVFCEQAMAYRIDEKGGIHPFVDVAFSSEFNAVSTLLSQASYGSARSSLEQAESALISSRYDGRAAIRHSFDALENIYKQIFPKETQLKSTGLSENLGPLIVKHTLAKQPETRATTKILESMKDWIDSGHFYRHDSGDTEQQMPTQELAIQYVALAVCFARWIVGFAKYTSEP